MPTLRPQAPSPKGMRPTSPSAPQAPSSTPVVPRVGLTEEEFGKKLKIALDEYYNAKDLAEVHMGFGSAVMLARCGKVWPVLCAGCCLVLALCLGCLYKEGFLMHVVAWGAFTRRFS